MLTRNTHDPDVEMNRPPGREGFRELLRRPVVRVLLVGTALAQFAAGGHKDDVARASRAEPAAAAEVTVALTPVVVSPQGEDRVERLARKYRSQGYNVSLPLARTIYQAAVEHEIDPDVAFGLIRAESSFRNGATSPVGAVGLTQLMPKTAAWMEPGITRSELRNPETNVRIGLKYLRKLIDKYEGDTNLALVAYNRGPGTVDRALKRGRNPDNGYAAFVRGEKNHGHKLFTD